MELKKRIGFRKVLIGAYFVAFAAYLIVGLQPAEAAKSYEIAAKLEIPGINLDTDVTELSLNGNRLDTPDTIAGSYSEARNKILLIGHSSTVFQNLKDVNLGDEIYYDGATYRIVKERFVVKSAIDMDEILAPASEKTLVIMTCAGANLGSGDATHRFMVTAVINAD